MSDKPMVGTNTTEPWTDDAHPWVNENMNANTKLGTAARVLARWEQDWYKETHDPATHESAHNDLADLADAITVLLAENAALHREVAALRAALIVPDDVREAMAEVLNFAERDKDANRSAQMVVDWMNGDEEGADNE